MAIATPICRTAPEVWLELAHSYTEHDLPWQAEYTARQALRLDASLEQHLLVSAIGHRQALSGGDALLGRTALPDASLLAERAFCQSGGLFGGLADLAVSGTLAGDVEGSGRAAGVRAIREGPTISGI